MRIVLSVILLLLVFTSCSQQDSVVRIPKAQQFNYKLGDEQIVLTQAVYEPTSPFFIIKLHDNEQTAEEAAKQFLQEHGGTFLKIENKVERFIQFKKRNKVYKFDPNRIFSREGISGTLKIFNSYTPTIANEVNRFANYLVKRIPDSSILVAVHNNTDKNYSIQDYLPSGELHKDVKAVYRNEDWDEDDFVFTTDSLLYKHFVEEKINAVLQNNTMVTDDGSLSVYYGARGRTYINIEAEYGHHRQQLEMLKTLLLFFEKNKNEMK